MVIEIVPEANRLSNYLSAPHLVAMGTFMNPDTTRIIAKRIILTGHPFKVHKKTATIRYMFFNPGKSFVCIFIIVVFLSLALKMTSTTSNLSSCTPNMDAPGISASHWAHMGTSRRTSMALSTKWTRSACPFTSGCSLSGPRSGSRRQMPNRTAYLYQRMQWRNRCLTAIYTLHIKNPFVVESLYV